jgi:peptidyl-prolyl cis-trans isomerase A (cyclophilin A)
MRTPFLLRPVPRCHRPASLLLLLPLLACNAPPPPDPDQDWSASVTEPSTAHADNRPASAQAAPAAPDKAAEPAKPEAQPAAAGQPEVPAHLLNPGLATRTAPDRYTVALETTKGTINIDVRRDWAPLGADRFYNLVRLGFFENLAFFRVLDKFVAQTGLHGSPEVNTAWRDARIADDPVKQSNTSGMVTFATSGPNSRTTQFFINTGDNVGLDRMGFAPFGHVRELDVARKLYSGYGEGAPSGRGPVQSRIQREGNAYLHEQFPDLDYIKSASIVAEVNAPAKQRPLPPPKKP